MADAALKGSRGPAFTAFEDLLVCKAFIAASEDPTVGAYQKGGTFQSNMHRIYCQFLDEHEKIASSLFESVPSSNNQSPTTFNRRTNKSIYDRFKNVVSPRVMKFIGITEVTPRESGKNDQDFYEQCKMLYSEQTTYGDFEPFKSCYEYLLKKPKFASWRELQDTGTGKAKKERPIGSKQAKKAQAVKEVARKIIVEEKRNNGGSGNVDSATIKAQDMRNMMDNFNAFMEMKMMREMGTGLSKEDLDLLETPDRKAYQKARAELMVTQMNELVAKRRRLAFAGASSSSSPSQLKPGNNSNTTSNTTTANTTANNSDDDCSVVEPRDS